LKQRFTILRDEIEDELKGISLLVQSLEKATLQELDAEIKKRVFASILSDFYMAVERIFKLIVKEIDLEFPEGEEWHKKILRQVTVSLPDLRPPVIEKKLFHRLEEYLKFRHLVRNIYGFQLNYERFEHLVREMNEVAASLHDQISMFLAKMQEVADAVE
jgi:hypothetical protein